MDDDAIRTLVTRLSRADSSGGGTIERAAILAEGSDLGAVVAWITAHGGEPEAAVSAVSGRGLHSSLSNSERRPESAPLRYVLPAGWSNWEDIADRLADAVEADSVLDRNCAATVKESQKIADALFPRQWIGDRQVGLDRVPVASPHAAAGDVPGVGKLADDAVGGALRDPNRVADLA
jgi:hypothetical protein